MAKIHSNIISIITFKLVWNNDLKKKPSYDSPSEPTPTLSHKLKYYFIQLTLKLNASFGEFITLFWHKTRRVDGAPGRTRRTDHRIEECLVRCPMANPMGFGFWLLEEQNKELIRFAIFPRSRRWKLIVRCLMKTREGGWEGGGIDDRWRAVLTYQLRGKTWKSRKRREKLDLPGTFSAPCCVCAV